MALPDRAPIRSRANDERHIFQNTTPGRQHAGPRRLGYQLRARRSARRAAWGRRTASTGWRTTLSSARSRAPRWSQARNSTHELATRQHVEMVDAYRSAGVTVHLLEVDESTPYQVYARDSSFMTPYGAVVCQLANPRRRGEYASVLRFYASAGIPLYDLGVGGQFRGRRLQHHRPRLRAHRLYWISLRGGRRKTDRRLDGGRGLGRFATPRSTRSTCTST